MDNPIPIRVHHVSSIKAAFSLSREEYVEMLLKEGYIENEEDPFISQTYDRFRDIFSNPAQRILVIANSPDFICNNCRHREDKCFSEEADYDYQASDPLLGHNWSSKSKERVINFYSDSKKLAANSTYSVKDLREILEF